MTIDMSVMDQLHIEYDGSLDGFLNVLARCVKEAVSPLSITVAGQRRHGMFDNVEIWPTDSEQAERLSLWLHELHPKALSLIIHAYLSDCHTLGRCALAFIYICLEKGKAATQLHTHEETAILLKHSAALSHEIHSFTGFVRFRELQVGVFYAPIAPVNNIVFYIAEHFVERLPLQKWVLHDTERKLALYWDKKQLQTVDVEEEFTRLVQAGNGVPKESVKEQEYQKLWQTFHTSIANPARKNKKLQKQFIPKRYWKYLVEKDV